MKKLLLLTGIALLSCGTANAATNCVPSSPHPSNDDLLKAIKCLQGSAVQYGDTTDLRFVDQNWCIARGDPGDNKVYTVPCSAGASGSGQTKIGIDKHQ
jgi:hypothetical protein